jgi:hypothetical protein
MLSKIMRRVLIVVGCVVLFGAGWISARYFHAGEQAMGTLIELVSAIGYLEKGDQANALRMMQISAEGNVVIVSKYGTPVLDWYEPKAREKWIQRYARIRHSNPPIEYPDGGAFRKKVDEILPPPSAAAKGKPEPLSK